MDQAPGLQGDSEHDAAESADDAPQTVVVSGSRDSGSGRRIWPMVLGFAAVAGLLVLGASQVYLINTLEQTREDLSATQSQLSSLDSRIAGVGLSVDDLAQHVDDLARATPVAGSASTPAPSIPAGHLPTFVQGQADQALGMVLSPVEARDAYSGAAIAIDPSDGTRRIWMVWAHWCPYCQEELPTLTSLHATMPEAFPGVELATITTSIDPSRGNPLDAYLVEQQFPFPVLVDDDSAVASQLGVSAFPFWVVTAEDGTVLARVAGYLDEARLTSLFQTVTDYEA